MDRSRPGTGVRRALGIAMAVAAVTASEVRAQQPGAGGGGGGGQPQTLAYAHSDSAGFVRIFDGTLNGWSGDPRFWRVSGDTLVGESTAERRVEQNTFFIYTAQPALRDFELKLEFRMPSGTGNSGVQVRSSVRPGAPHEWRLTGYQVDMDFNNNFTGMVYGEGAGGFLAPRGQITQIRSGSARPQQIGTLGTATELKGLMNTNGWNQLHIVFRGNTLTTILNGRVTSVLIDEDPTASAPSGEARLAQGLIGLQMHTGAPFAVQYRNIYLKQY